MPKETKKILINAITLDEANIVPLLLKIKKWQDLGAEITFFGDEFFRRRIEKLGTINKYEYILFRVNTGNIMTSSRLGFARECLWRNIQGFFYLKQLKNRFDLVYSISSVLDLVLIPYFLKRKEAKIKWATVFDNTVPLFSDGRMIAGNKIIRILAWLFFQCSLFFLKKADIIFTMDEELKKYLIVKKFPEEKIKITGVGLEIDLIKNAKVKKEYRFDALFIGRINEAKGIFDLVKIIRIVKKEIPDFRLAIMGDGDETTKNKLRKAILRLNLSGNIRLLGYVDGQEKFDIVKSSKCFIFPSYTESVGISLLEAVSSGKKAFAYNLDAYGIYEKNEIDISEKGNFRDMAGKILRLFEKGDFSNEGGKKLLEKFDWEKIARQEAEGFNLICEKAG